MTDIWRGVIKAIMLYEAGVSQVRIDDEERGVIVLGCDTWSLSRFMEAFHEVYGKDELAAHPVYYQVGELGSLTRLVPMDLADPGIAEEYGRQRAKRKAAGVV